MKTKIRFTNGRWALEVWDERSLVAVGREIIGEDVHASLRDVEGLVLKAYELGLRDGSANEKRKHGVRAEL